MTIKEVTTFRTSDGATFGSRELAEAHEHVVTMRPGVEKWAAAYGKENESSERHVKNLADYVMAYLEYVNARQESE